VPPAAYFKQAVRDKLIEYKQYVRKHGDDVTETASLRWSQGQQGARVTSTEGDNVQPRGGKP
jgi:xylulose-5-phosphate/fructose-6-phosphate phosphoketolase